MGVEEMGMGPPSYGAAPKAPAATPRPCCDPAGTGLRWRLPHACLESCLQKKKGAKEEQKAVPSFVDIPAKAWRWLLSVIRVS